MPAYKRKYSTGYKSKDVKRRKKSSVQPRKIYPTALCNPRVGSVTGKVPGFPEKFKFVHKYAEQVDMSSSSGSSARQRFTCNNMYDPNNTGVGHQPLYFDQLAQLYDHFYVISSKIKFTVIPQGTSVQAPFRLFAQVNDDTTVSAGTGDAVVEQTTGQSRYCTGGLNPSKEVIYMKYDGLEKWGQALLSNSRQRGNDAGGPSEQSHFELNLNSCDNSSTVSVHVMAEIEFTAIWVEGKDTAQSWLIFLLKKQFLIPNNFNFWFFPNRYTITFKPT